MRIAWIGLGVMGRSMAGHLMDAGYQLRVHTRTPSTAADLIARGATWADTPAEAAAGSGYVATMVGHPHEVADVVLGRDGVLAGAAPGTVLIDFTTSQPDLAVRIAGLAAERGIGALDAPVSGGDVGARDATLSIMVGGDDADVAAARPILERLGRSIVHQGPPGAGQHTKAVNQILIAGTMVGLAEALTYAATAGLDLDAVLDSVGGGAAASWSLTHLAPRALAGDLAPGFRVDHFVKDLGIALEEAGRMQLRLPSLALAQRLYAELRDQGGASLGTQALLDWMTQHGGADR